jgi:uncharacterized membrane protein
VSSGSSTAGGRAGRGTVDHAISPLVILLTKDGRGRVEVTLRMIQSTTGLIHTIAATCALIAGLVIFSRPKATTTHRVLGYLYVVSMLIMLSTSLTIYHLTHHFNFLHFFTLIATPPLLLGLSFAMFRRPRGAWVGLHYYWMNWSYIGLVSAFAAEMTTRVIMPFAYHHYGIRSMGLFWGLVGGASFVITIGGAVLMKKNQRLVLRHARTGR